MLINLLRFGTSLALVATFAAAEFAASPAFSATSDWALSEGGRMRVVALSPDAGGNIRAALQIEPKPGWITYWREPGESGIPPQLTVADGGNVALQAIAYPVPKPLMIGSIEELGYDSAVTLPLDFKVTDGSKSAKLDLTAFIGMCRDICIPFQGNFSLPLPQAGTAGPEETAVLDAATASLPRAPSPDFSVENHALSADGKVLSLTLALPDPDGAAPEIYVTGPSGYVFFKQADAKHDGKRFDVDIAIGRLPKTYTIHGKSWGLVVVQGKRAMETTLAFD
ncbi:protein-disulfide reductase DsbD domain-containing protein [Rhizobium tubonense]|uniref:Cytochrome C biogenesis protein n=1 Tax=Rhizobium tubonense TaxID=484088 RepID=A0A2W4DZW4_9HYPH|nr:protein-disulfide reductase DsbD domain-containing protein [Rhizobium tubonense]PZM09206.1 cytochrome C biogenesis protein [Rhizobium tubonense]